MKSLISMKYILAAIFSVTLFCLVPFCSYAEIKTGGIDVELSCYEEDRLGIRRKFEKQPQLMPKEQVSYVLAVKNKGSDAWIRLLVSFEKKDEGKTQETIPDDSWLYGISNEWVKKGQYWYYKTPVKKGMEVDFCQGIRVPDIDDLPEGMTFSVAVRAEAVQAANLELDFRSDEPFSGIIIEDSVGESDREETVNGFEVRYENGSDTIVKADGLFSNVGEIMPADLYIQTVVIENNNRFPVRVTLKESGEKLDDILLKMLNLLIRRGETVVYQGAFADLALKNGLILGEFSGKSLENLEFELSLSEHAKNETSFREIPIAMTFSVERVRQESSDRETDGEDSKNKDIHMYACPDPSISEGYAGGSWRLINEEKHQWEYVFSDGSKAKNGWLYLYNPYSQDQVKNNWFCFDERGTMQFGWIRTENHNWYFCHEISDGNLGTLKRGWHFDRDDLRQYYLDPVTGIMQTGWRLIDGNYYYFTPLEQTKAQSWFWNTGVGRWLYEIFGYRTYGSMYRGEKTPDGYVVDENGVWNGQEKADKEIC